MSGIGRVGVPVVLFPLVLGPVLHLVLALFVDVLVLGVVFLLVLVVAGLVLGVVLVFLFFFALGDLVPFAVLGVFFLRLFLVEIFLGDLVGFDFVFGDVVFGVVGLEGGSSIGVPAAVAGASGSSPSGKRLSLPEPKTGLWPVRVASSSARIFIRSQSSGVMSTSRATEPLCSLMIPAMPMRSIRRLDRV